MLSPVRYKNVTVFDVTSLYPTMIVNNNISFETINCKCCSEDLNARVPNYLFSDRKKPKKCHICARYQGVLTKQIADYMAKRLEYKRLSKNQSLSQNERREFEIISNSYKILSNSAYGQMGHEFSKYENVLAG